MTGLRAFVRRLRGIIVQRHGWDDVLMATVSIFAAVYVAWQATGIGGANYRTVVDYWYGNGYAGALPWQDGTYMINFPNLKSFADAHACETQY